MTHSRAHQLSTIRLKRRGEKDDVDVEKVRAQANASMPASNNHKDD